MGGWRFEEGRFEGGNRFECGWEDGGLRREDYRVYPD